MQREIVRPAAEYVTGAIAHQFAATLRPAHDATIAITTKIAGAVWRYVPLIARL